MSLWEGSRGAAGAARMAFVALGFVLLCLGLAVKSTYVVIAIGYLVVLLVDCLRKRDGAWGIGLRAARKPAKDRLECHGTVQ